MPLKMQGLEIEIVPTLVFGAARFPEFGLTAYSLDEFTAVAKLERMLASAIHAHRMEGTLDEWLNLSGVEWRRLEGSDER